MFENWDPWSLGNNLIVISVSFLRSTMFTSKTFKESWPTLRKHLRTILAGSVKLSLSDGSHNDIIFSYLTLKITMVQGIDEELLTSIVNRKTFSF